jgi:hypothetical protein
MLHSWHLALSDQHLQVDEVLSDAASTLKPAPCGAQILATNASSTDVQNVMGVLFSASTFQVGCHDVLYYVIPDRTVMPLQLSLW